MKSFFVRKRMAKQQYGSNISPFMVIVVLVILLSLTVTVYIGYATWKCDDGRGDQFSCRVVSFSERMSVIFGDN